MKVLSFLLYWLFPPPRTLGQNGIGMDSYRVILLQGCVTRQIDRVQHHITAFTDWHYYLLFDRLCTNNGFELIFP